MAHVVGQGKGHCSISSDGDVTQRYVGHTAWWAAAARTAKFARVVGALLPLEGVAEAEHHPRQLLTKRLPNHRLPVRNSLEIYFSLVHNLGSHTQSAYQ
jgi:hypothetical protein